MKHRRPNLHDRYRWSRYDDPDTDQGQALTWFVLGACVVLVLIIAGIIRIA